MGHPIDPNVDFDRALAAAAARQRDTPPDEDVGGIETGEPSPAPLEYDREATPATPPRDESGRFTATPDPDDDLPDPLQRFRTSPTPDDGREPNTYADDGLEPDEPPALEPEQPEQQQFDRLLAGKYKTVEELERAYTTEAQDVITRQGNELAELRRTVQQLAQPAAQPGQQLQPVFTEDQLEELVSDPAIASRFVHELYTNEHPAFRAALNKWAEYAPGDAMLFSSGVQAQAAEKRVRDEYDARFAPMVAERKQMDWLDAWAELSEQAPDMGNFGQQMLEDLQANPGLSAPIMQGLPGAERMVIENLYLRAQARSRPQAAAVEREQQQKAETMRREAHVATGGSTPARSSGGPDDAVKALKDSILKYDRGQSVSDAIGRGRDK